MDNLFEKWKTKIPKYGEEFREKLFEALAGKAATEKTRIDLGRHFTTNYELYMYAFFLGLYRNEFLPISEKTKKVDFSHHIQYWGSKGNRLERKDFTILQEYIFAALVAKSDVDFIALEKGNITEDDAVKELLNIMESYTNGGLTLITEKYDENPNFFLQPTSFLMLILDSKPFKNK